MMSHNEQRTFSAVVISAGYSPAAFDIVRALGMMRISSAVASSQRDDIAFSSRHCASRLVLPPFRTANEMKILELLTGFARRQHHIPVLYYASDAELSFVWRNRNVLGKFFRFLLPTDEVTENLFNKVRFSSFALQHRLPIPRTTVASSVEDLVEKISAVEFPCIVKPAYSEDWTWDTQEQRERFGSYKDALHRITSKHELLSFCSALPVRRSGFLIQTYIEGSDENILSFHGYFDEHSRCLGSFIGKKVRTFPPQTGGSTYVQTIHHPELSRLSIKYLQRIRYRGIVKIDYKWDSVRREFKILEINPRYNLWEVVGAYAGINLVYIAHRHQRGESLPVSQYYKGNVWFLYFKQDIRSLAGYRRLGEWSILSYISSLVRNKHYRVFDPSDIDPFAASVFGFVVRNVQRLFQTGKAPRPSAGENTSRIRNSEEMAVPRQAVHEDMFH